MLSVFSARYSSPKWQAYVTPRDTAFSFNGDQKIRSMWELKEALTNLPEDVIVSQLKPENNLANWVEHVVKDIELAEQFCNTEHRWGCIVALERHMMRSLNLPHFVAQRWLESSEYAFSFKSGESAHSLEELLHALDKVSDDTVLFHLERDPNDISRWVEDVIGDYELAELLNDASHRTQMKTFVEDRLSLLREAAG